MHIFSFIIIFIAIFLLLIGTFLIYCANNKNVEAKITEDFSEERLKRYKDIMDKTNLQGFIFIIIAISLIVAEIFC